MKTSGLLTRMSLAWVGADGDKKFLCPGPHARKSAASCGTWLAEGANIYICGDAQADGQGCRTRAGRYRRPVRGALDRRGRPLCRGTQKRRAGSNRTFIDKFQSAQIRTNKNSRLNSPQRIFDCNRSLSKRSYRYFQGRLVSRRNRYSIVANATLEIDYARTIGGSPPAPAHALPFGGGRDMVCTRAALYGAFALIAAVVFGNPVGSPVLGAR